MKGGGGGGREGMPVNSFCELSVREETQELALQHTAPMRRLAAIGGPESIQKQGRTPGVQTPASTGLWPHDNVTSSDNVG